MADEVVGKQVGMDSEKLEAIVEVMFLAADADGEFSKVERDELCGAVVGVVGEAEGWGSEKLTAFLLNCEQRLAGEGSEARLAALKESLGEEQHRELALRSAIQVMASDGIVRTSEREFLLQLADALGIAGERAADLVIAVSRRS
jgi:tellurite resistance protein